MAGYLRALESHKRDQERAALEADEVTVALALKRTRLEEEGNIIKGFVDAVLDEAVSAGCKGSSSIQVFDTHVSVGAQLDMQLPKCPLIKIAIRADSGKVSFCSSYKGDEFGDRDIIRENNVGKIGDPELEFGVDACFEATFKAIFEKYKN